MRYDFDPELAKDIDKVPSPRPGDVAGSRAWMKDQMAQMPPPDLSGVSVEDHRGAGPPGSPEVPVRIYRPDRVVVPAGIYEVHAGGFTTGDLEMDHAMCVGIARELGVVIVSSGTALRRRRRTPVR